MRSIDATLKAAIATGSIDMVARLKVYISGVYYTSLQVFKYSLSGTELDVTVADLIPASNSPDDIKIVLERGVTIAGVEYVLDTGKFSPKTGAATNAVGVGIIKTSVKAHIVPSKRITFAGDVSYRIAITSFCTAIGKTPVFVHTAAAHWDYQFLPTGKVYTTNNAQAFLTLLRQKYLIYGADNGSEQMIFYYALEIPATQANIQPLIYDADVGFYQSRRFLSRDENNTVRYGGSVDDPLYNLGFILSTENQPAIHYQNQAVSFTIPINLEYQCGDAYNVDNGNFYVYPAEVVEVFDPKRSPSWALDISQLVYFTGTEGGTLPSTIEAAAPYTPLNTSTFDHVLSSDDNNLQAAMQTLDDHLHDADYAPIANGVTGGDNHDHNGGDGAQIDHLNLANIGGYSHADIDNFIASGGASADLWNEQLIQDEFVGGLATTGNVGSLGWMIQTPLTVAGVAITSAHPGIIDLKTGSTAGIGGLTIDPIASNGTCYGSGFKYVGFIVKPVTNWSTAGTMHFGFQTSFNTGDTSTGYYFTKKDGDANWYACKCYGGQATRTDTGVAWTAGNWYLLEIKHVGTDFLFYINTNLVATIAQNTNINISAGHIGLMFETTNTTPKEMLLDWFGVEFSAAIRWT